MSYEIIRATFAGAYQEAEETGRSLASFLEVLAIKDAENLPEEGYVGTGTIVAHSSAGGRMEHRCEKTPSGRSIEDALVEQSAKKGKNSTLLIPEKMPDDTGIGFITNPGSYTFSRLNKGYLFFARRNIRHWRQELPEFGNISFHILPYELQDEISEKLKNMVLVNGNNKNPYVGPLLLGGKNLERTVTIMSPFAEYSFVLVGGRSIKEEKKGTFEENGASAEAVGGCEPEKTTAEIELPVTREQFYAEFYPLERMISDARRGRRHSQDDWALEGFFQETERAKIKDFPRMSIMTVKKSYEEYIHMRDAAIKKLDIVPSKLKNYAMDRFFIPVMMQIKEYEEPAF